MFLVPDPFQIFFTLGLLLSSLISNNSLAKVASEKNACICLWQVPHRSAVAPNFPPLAFGIKWWTVYLFTSLRHNSHLVVVLCIFIKRNRSVIIHRLVVIII